jgi:membrane fusion protein, multidrug efflux system
MRPGMFVQARVLVGDSGAVVTLPASAISYAPYGDSVFVVAEMKGPGGAPYRGVRQQFVKLGGARGDQVAVVSGVDSGAEVVTSGAFKLRNGAAVQVSNEVQPSNSPAPSPEDN